MSRGEILEMLEINLKHLQSKLKNSSESVDREKAERQLRLLAEHRKRVLREPE